VTARNYFDGDTYKKKTPAYTTNRL